MMKQTVISAAALALAALCTPALARQHAPQPTGKETSIPFVRFGNIHDFEADGDRGIYLQNRSRQWYYGAFSGPCTNLPFAIRIATDTRFAGNQLDRTGRIYVDGETCYLMSLVKSGPPPKRGQKKH